MKLTFIVLFSSFIMYVTWGATCRNDSGTCVGATGNPSGCKANSVQACWVKSDVGTCKRVLNSSGGVMFIPARTDAELSTVPGDYPVPNFCL